MSPKKTIFIIPGYRQSSTSKAYKAIAVLFAQHGYEPIILSFSWKQSILQNTEYFLKEYKKVRRKKKYILGFSFGAMIAFLAATKVKVSGLILCSLSPFFKEDSKKEFFDLQFAQLVKKVKADQIVLLYGVKEARSLINRVKETFLHISSKKKKLLPIKNTDHSIGNKNYLQIIHQAVKILQ